MPVIGAVLDLSPEPAARQAALDYLRNHPDITVGDEQARGLPIVLETDSRSQDRALFEDLESLPGILGLAVVYADVSDITLPGGQT